VPSLQNRFKHIFHFQKPLRTASDLFSRQPYKKRLACHVDRWLEIHKNYSAASLISGAAGDARNNPAGMTPQNPNTLLSTRKGDSQAN
jgi:hypothetical protein